MKKIVHYRTAMNLLKVGAPAFVDQIDHPDFKHVSNTTTVRTSRIVRMGEGGEFETENTIYRLAE